MAFLHRDLFKPIILSYVTGAQASEKYTFTNIILYPTHKRDFSRVNTAELDTESRLWMFYICIREH